MPKSRIFKTAARKEQQMKTLERRLKKTDVSSLSTKKLTAYIQDAERLIRYKGERQRAALNGFESSLIHRNVLNWNKRTGDINNMSRQTLLSIAQKDLNIIGSRKLTITGAREERTAKLQALHDIGLKRPETSDIQTFWGNFMELKEHGLPYYLEKASGLEINGMYVLADVYKEFKSLPREERTDERLRSLAVSRFTNLQRSMQGYDASSIEESAKKNWERYHHKKLNRELTESELRTYSTFGVGAAVKQQGAMANLADYIDEVIG